LTAFETIYAVEYTAGGLVKLRASPNFSSVPDSGEYQSSGVTVREAESAAIAWFQQRFGVALDSTDLVLRRLGFGG
jgi:hypothetical protein